MRHLPQSPRAVELYNFPTKNSSDLLDPHWRQNTPPLPWYPPPSQEVGGCSHAGSGPLLLVLYVCVCAVAGVLTTLCGSPPVGTLSPRVSADGDGVSWTEERANLICKVAPNQACP